MRPDLVVVLLLLLQLLLLLLVVQLLPPLALQLLLLLLLLQWLLLLVALLQRLLLLVLQLQRLLLLMVVRSLRRFVSLHPSSRARLLFQQCREPSTTGGRAPPRILRGPLRLWMWDLWPRLLPL